MWLVFTAMRPVFTALRRQFGELSARAGGYPAAGSGVVLRNRVQPGEGPAAAVTRRRHGMLRPRGMLHASWRDATQCKPCRHGAPVHWGGGSEGRRNAVLSLWWGAYSIMPSNAKFAPTVNHRPIPHRDSTVRTEFGLPNSNLDLKCKHPSLSRHIELMSGWVGWQIPTFSAATPS